MVGSDSKLAVFPMALENFIVIFLSFSPSWSLSWVIVLRLRFFIEISKCEGPESFSLPFSGEEFFFVRNYWVLFLSIDLVCLKRKLVDQT